jgi:uncharacterized protein (TIGR04255 family)
MERRLPPLRLSRSPLVYVVAQVRISAVIAIDKYIPDIQEQLRHRGFPRFKREQVRHLRLDFGAEPKFNISERFEFLNKDQTTGLILAPDFVALHGSQYQNFENFKEMLGSGLEIIHRALQIGLTERIGIRYVDLVRVREGEALGDYLQPGLLGLDPTTMGVRSSLSRFEFVGLTEVGKLIVRCSTAQGEEFLPPDLEPTSLKFDITPEPNESRYILDFDHSSEGAEASDFSIKGVLDSMQQLHNNLDLAFRHAVTEQALTRWGNEEVEERNDQ